MFKFFNKFLVWIINFFKVKKPINWNLDNFKKNDWNMVLDILYIINLHRETIDEPYLILDDNIASKYACDHTNYMISSKKLTYKGKKERLLGITNQLPISEYGENISKGFSNSVELLQYFLNSKKEKNINNNFTHVGIGVFQDSNQKYYCTLIFYKKKD